MTFDSTNREISSSGVGLLEPPRPIPVVLHSRRRPERGHASGLATNADLVQRANDGDRLAWEELVERYAGLVEAVGARHRLDRHDINDVSQLTWLRLTQHLGQLHDPERVGLWLYTTARRECQALIKRSGRIPPVEVDDAPSSAAEQPEELIGRAERAHHLRRALARLPEACRTLLELMLVQDPPAPYTEISERCDIAVGTIGPRRKRCLAHLRRLYDEVFPDSDIQDWS
ncbi:MAG: sigma-70 family RNA polymerase sigma factor [Acidimicrobiales bacterium]